MTNRKKIKAELSKRWQLEWQIVLFHPFLLLKKLGCLRIQVSSQVRELVSKTFAVKHKRNVSLYQYNRRVGNFNSRYTCT